jgi:hypothetical protein
VTRDQFERVEAVGAHYPHPPLADQRQAARNLADDLELDLTNRRLLPHPLADRRLLMRVKRVLHSIATVLVEYRAADIPAVRLRVVERAPGVLELIGRRRRW